MATTFQETITLERMTCGGCGITFAVPQIWIEKKRQEGGGFTCPNGCCRVYRESEVDRLRKQLEEKDRALTASKCETMKANQLLFTANREKESAEKKLRRVNKGVCPCCNRSFTDLRRHMECKHPDYKKSDA